MQTTDFEEQSLWRQQERLRLASRAEVEADPGEPDAVLYRHVFAALDNEPMPSLPDDFYADVAAKARRMAAARIDLARFKRMLLSLFCLLYLPPMLVALWATGVPAWLTNWSDVYFSQNPLPHWFALVAVLAIFSAAIDSVLGRRTGRAMA